MRKNLWNVRRMIKVWLCLVNLKKRRRIEEEDGEIILYKNNKIEV